MGFRGGSEGLPALSSLLISFMSCHVDIVTPHFYIEVI